MPTREQILEDLAKLLVDDGTNRPRPIATRTVKNALRKLLTDTEALKLFKRAAAST